MVCERRCGRCVRHRHPGIQLRAAAINAFDYVYKEWNYKPAGFVSYGGVSGGLRAVQMEKQTLTTLKVVPIVEAVVIPMAAQSIADGRFNGNELQTQAAKVMLDELLRWAAALQTLRE
jgi:NAD(P)H-dependent FMN reductase